MKGQKVGGYKWTDAHVIGNLASLVVKTGRGGFSVYPTDDYTAESKSLRRQTEQTYLADEVMLCPGPLHTLPNLWSPFAHDFVSWRTRYLVIKASYFGSNGRGGEGGGLQDRRLVINVLLANKTLQRSQSAGFIMLSKTLKERRGKTVA